MDKSILDALAALGYGENVDLPVADLTIPKEFQRKHKPRNWGSWIPAQFGRLTVAKVKNPETGQDAYVVVDGQHRLKEAERFKIEKVPCILHTNLPLPLAAALFVNDNGERVSIPAADAFRATCFTGDALANELDEALLARNLDGHCRGRAARDLTAIGSVWKLVTDFGVAHACYALDMIGEIWPWYVEGENPESEEGEHSVKDSPHVRAVRGFGQFVRPEKKVTGLKYPRRWKHENRDLLVRHLAKKYPGGDGMEFFLLKAQHKRPGGGGGGGSLGCEMLLNSELASARAKAREEAKQGEDLAA